MVSCASLSVLRPPRSRARSGIRYHPRPRSHLRYCSRLRPRSRPYFHPVFVDESPSPPPSPFPPRPRSRPRSRPRFHPALLRSPPPRLPFPFPLQLRPRPHHRSRPLFHPRPHYRLRSRPLTRSLFSVPRIWLPLDTMRVYRHRALRTELPGPRERHSRLQRWWRVRNERVSC